jgi:Putative Ig domain
MTTSTTYARTNNTSHGKVNAQGIPGAARAGSGCGGQMTEKKSWGLAAVCLSILLLGGCRSSAPAITVQIQPTSSISIDEGQPLSFTATVANDTLNQGVSWSLLQTSSTTCSGTGCGILKNATNSSVTYVAPTGISAEESITLTAASVSQPTATATATISVVLPVTFTTITLPNGANGVPYNQTIVVTGGVAPLTFSLQPGSSLPPGLSLNATGSIVGSPSAPAVSQPTLQRSFTVVVTDFANNGATPFAVSQAFTISVTAPPVLSINTTSLPGALTNSKYSSTVAATGGVLPIMWSLLPGTGAAPFNTLPPGLALSPTSGQIAGTIAASCTTPLVPGCVTPGNYSFTVQGLDSSLPSGQTAQHTFSINVQAPAPLAITTTVLPSGTTATPYSLALQASGGITPYTWTTTSGLLPSGLTLSPNGTLSGTPEIVTTSDQFTVQLQDSEAVPQVISQALTIAINAGSTSSNSLVTGAYSFLFNGFDTSGSVMIAGSLTTDGNGNITTGLEDSNRASGVVTGIPLTGTYSLGSDGRGTMQLIATNPTTHVTLTTDYRFVLDSSNTIHFIQDNDITTAGVGTDTVGTHGEGILRPVVGNATAASFNGNYSFLFSGQDMSAKPTALGGVIRADGTSSLIPAAGGVSSDLNDNGVLSSQNISGAFSVGASNNRGAASLLFEIPGKSQSTLQFALYFVSQSDIFFVETDTTATELSPIFYRLSGEMIAQPPSVAFANTSLTGTSVATATALGGTNASILVGLLTSSSATPGTASLNYDENNGGTITSPSPSFSGTYVVATNGRVSFTSLGPRAAVAYLTGPGQGFLLGGDANVTTGLLEQQTGIATFGTNSIQGGYALGTSFPAETSVPNLVGQISSNGASSVTGTIDEILPPATATPEGTAILGGTLTAHINFTGPTGRGTMTAGVTGTTLPLQFPAGMVFYIVSPAHFRAISADSNPGNGHPEVFFFDH